MVTTVAVTSAAAANAAAANMAAANAAAAHAAAANAAAAQCAAGASWGSRRSERCRWFARRRDGSVAAPWMRLTVINGVNFFNCGGVFYRAGFQGNSVVYIVSVP